MQTQEVNTVRNANAAAVVTFAIVFGLITTLVMFNAPTRLGADVTASVGSYLAEVRTTAMPFVAAVLVIATGIGVAAAIIVRREWPYPGRRRELLAGYAFLAPYLIVTLMFTISVVLFAFYISFFQYDIFTKAEFVGLGNYFKAFSKKDFLQALHNVLWYAAIVVPLQTSLAILMAVFLNGPMKFRQFFRTIFYAPSVTSSVVITLIFIWLYLKTGYVNLAFSKTLGVVGFQWQAIDWLKDPRGLIQIIVTALGGTIPSNLWYLRGPSVAWLAIMAQNVFTTVPTFMVMFLAALQDVNPSIYEAADIDGAGPRQQFFKITLPMLRPIILLVVVLGTIGTLQVFDQVFLATQGGPLNTTSTPVYMVFVEALGKQGSIQMGYASALAFLVAVLIFAFTFIQRRFLERGAEMY